MERRRAIVIEDDDAFALLIADWLKRVDCDCDRARDGAAGINMAAAAPPDLIVLDLMMPGFGSGADTLAVLRKHPDLKCVPVIVATALPLERLKLPKGDPWLWSLSKAAPAAELFSLIKEVLGVSEP